MRESSLEAESVLLKDTPDHLVEAGAGWDTFWGPGRLAWEGSGGGLEVGGGGDIFWLRRRSCADPDDPTLAGGESERG